MKKIFLLGLLLFAGILLGKSEKIINSETINKGIVIAYGKFIERPYKIKLTSDYKIYINDILYYPRKTKKKSYLTEKEKEKVQLFDDIRFSIYDYYKQNFNKYGFEKAREMTLKKYKNHKWIKNITIDKYQVTIYFGGTYYMGFPLDPRDGNPDMSSYFKDVMKIRQKTKEEIKQARKEALRKKKKKILTQAEKNEKTLKKFESLITHLKNDDLVTFCEYSNYGNLIHTKENTFKLIKIIKDYNDGKVSEKDTKLRLSYLPEMGDNKYYLYFVDKNDIEKIYKILSKEVEKYKENIEIVKTKPPFPLCEKVFPGVQFYIKFDYGSLPPDKSLIAKYNGKTYYYIVDEYNQLFKQVQKESNATLFERVKLLIQLSRWWHGYRVEVTDFKPLSQKEKDKLKKLGIMDYFYEFNYSVKVKIYSWKVYNMIGYIRVKEGMIKHIRLHGKDFIGDYTISPLTLNNSDTPDVTIIGGNYYYENVE